MNGQRFAAKRSITDSGRTKVWRVVDTEGVFPGARFAARKTEAENRALALRYARILNEGAFIDELSFAAPAA